jgi:hypothetical protein
MPRIFNAIITVGVSLTFLWIVVPSMFAGYPSAYTGLNPGEFGTTGVTIDPGSPAAKAGLRGGDTIRCLHIRDYEMLFPSYQLPAYSTSPIHGCSARDGVEVPFALVARPGPPAQDSYGGLGFVVLRVAVYVVFLFVGSALVILRPSLMTWLLFVFCVNTSPAAASADGLTSLSPVSYFLAALPNELGALVSATALLLFTLVFPDESLPGGWRRAAFWIVCVVSLVAVALKLQQMFGTVTIGPYDDPISSNVKLVMAIAVVGVTLGRFAGMRPADRARFSWVALGIVLGVVANYLRSSSLPGLIPVFAGISTVVMPIALMYAILRRHVIDVRFAISRAVVYAVVTTAIIGVIASVDFLTGEYLRGLRIALAINALVTIALGVALHRMYRTIENAVDFIIYRKKHEAESYLKRLAQTLLRAEREETIDRAVVDDPYERLDLAMAALLRADGDRYSTVSTQGWNGAAPSFEREHEVVRFLTTERRRLELRDLGKRVKVEITEPGVMPAIAVPIFEADDLRGFALYGVHRDGTKLDPDEVDVLETLCQTAAQAYVRIENLRMRQLISVLPRFRPNP